MGALRASSVKAAAYLGAWWGGLLLLILLLPLLADVVAMRVEPMKGVVWWLAIKDYEMAASKGMQFFRAW